MVLSLIRSQRWRALAGVAALAGTGLFACAAAPGAGAAPHPMTVTDGNETVNISDPFSYVMSADGVPSANQGVITGSGFTPGQNVYIETCNGVNPATTLNYNPNGNCFNSNAAVLANSSGDISINTANPSYQWSPYHGEDPLDSYFNCLAPDDNPNGTVTVVGDQAIDSSLPSWGASSVGTSGGGTAPCQLRIFQLPGTYQASDIYVPITGLDDDVVAEAPGTPTSPTAQAVPGQDGTVGVSFSVAPVTTTAGQATSYSVTATDTSNPDAAPVTQTGDEIPVDVTGLTEGDTYTFTVTASNSYGSSSASSPTAPLTVPGGVAPDAPAAPTATTAGPGGATVSFTPASTGGVATSYEVTATDTTDPSAPPVTATGASSPINVAGLTSGDTYTFTVTAINSAGQATSPASAPLTITAGTAPTITGTLAAATAGKAYSGSVTIGGSPTPTVTASGLPSGLTISQTGVISGTTTKAGKYSVQVTATNSVGTAVKQLTLTVDAGAASKVTEKAGNNQTATADAAFKTNLEVSVVDAYGNLASGAKVTFTVKSGPARFDGKTTATATASTSGLATAPKLTAEKTTGTVTVDATVSGGKTAAAFTLHVKAGAASKLVIKVGNNQSVAEGKTYAKNLEVLLTDAYGNVISGQKVTFTVKSGPARFAGKTAVTVTSSSKGLATAAKLTAEKTTGTVTVDAAASGVKTAAKFTLHVTR